MNSQNRSPSVYVLTPYLLCIKPVLTNSLHLIDLIFQFGMEQNYQLGKYFLSRYPTLINPCFDVRDLLVQSTDLDRVIMSALQISAGMYPDKLSDSCIDGNYEIKKLRWQAVPDHVLTFTGANRLVI